jgi:hypothetical protein
VKRPTVAAGEQYGRAFSHSWPDICNGLTAIDQQQDLFRRIDAVELSREASLAGYTDTEYYTISNSHFSRPAEVTVETTYKRGEGKTYKILSRSGPLLLPNNVMEAASRGKRNEPGQSAGAGHHHVGEIQHEDNRSRAG